MTEPAADLSEATRDALAGLMLAIADDEFVIGFWDSEWTGIAPMLEEDVATSSISQDEIGHAKALYELLASLTGQDADAIAFGRAPEAYRHAALMNHPRTDWAFTVARRYLYETADSVRLEALARCSYEPLAQLAAKMRREERYHLMHLDAWLRRLAGDPDAHTRLASAIRALWRDALAIFSPVPAEEVLVRGGELPEAMDSLRRRWLDQITPLLADLGLPGPTQEDLRTGAEDGRSRRTDDFRWLHSQFTMVAASESGATW